MTSHQNKIQVISAPEGSSDPIDATEAAQLVGYNPQETEQLIEDQYKLIQENEGGDSRPSYEHPMIRFASVALPLGAIGGGALGLWFLVFAPRSNQDAEPIASPTPTPSLVPNAEGRLKSQLAFQDQQASLEKTNARNSVKSKKSASKSSTQKGDQPKETIPVRRTITTDPEPPRIARSVSPPTPVVTRSIVQPQAISSPEVVDPNARWNALAKLGQQQSQLSDSARSTDQTQIASAPNSTIPTVQIGIAPEPSTSIESPKASSSPDLISSNEASIIRSDLDMTSSPSAPTIASPNQVQQPEFSSPVLPDSPMQVAIGTTVQAKVVVPAIAAENSRERSLIELTEDVTAINGRIALPKGTLIATEITKVDPQTRLVHQTAIAIIYKNRFGQVQQQPIPAGSLAVRDQDSAPLMAQPSQPSDDPIGRDLLIATLSGIEKVGAVINRPQEENFFSSDRFGSTQISRRTTRQPDLLAAALEGALGVTVDRLKQRVDQAETTRSMPVLTIPKGQPVSIVFTSFFEIRR